MSDLDPTAFVKSSITIVMIDCGAFGRRASLCARMLRQLEVLAGFSVDLRTAEQNLMQVAATLRDVSDGLAAVANALNPDPES